MTVSRGAPVGAILIQKFVISSRNRRAFHQTTTLVLTFIAYAAYHMSRRPQAVVKNSLNRDCSREKQPDNLIINDENKDNWCDWEPFNSQNANRLLGILDSVYVFAYAVCMFISGMIAERIDLRYYLSLGMLLSGIFTYLFGLAYYLNIHNYAYFLTVQLFAGAVQCTGWPAVVACVGNWFGKKRRGLIFGIWNAHLYVGNILGVYIAGYFVAENWGLSFIVPAALLGLIGFILFLFMVPHPEDVDCEPAVHHEPSEKKQFGGNKVIAYRRENGVQSFPENVHLAKGTEKTNAISCNKRPITFLNTLKIPGVLEFSLCLLFCKLVSYTFLFWLPRYLDHIIGAGSQRSAYLSIPFDVGGILGGILAGIISDYTRSSAMTCVAFLALAVPMLFLYNTYGITCLATNMILQVICGALVNGPYALITTAVSAELGTHPSIKNNSKALSTVTAIIDGTGSIGAAIGSFLAGIVSEVSWSSVFYMMMFADLCALIALLRPAIKETKRLCANNNCLCLSMSNICCSTKYDYQNI